MAGVGLDGSQLNPGLTIRLTVSPSLTLYSFRSFPSARAFPFNRSRCASAGGAKGCDASCDLIEEIVSVGWTGIVNDAGGFRDLKRTEIEAVSERYRMTRPCVTSESLYLTY